MGTNVAVYNGNNVPGLNASGPVTPSDSTGDASSTQQVEMVNSAVAVFPSSCTGPCGQPSAPLYGLVGASPSDCVFDPQVAWDEHWGHWIFAATVQHSSAAGGCKGDVNANITEDRLTIGWTYTSDANDFLNGNVCWTPIDRGTNLDDYPKLGHDDSHIVVGANVFSNHGQGPFQYSAVWVVGKPAGVSTTNPCGIGWAGTQSWSLGSSVFTPVPANMTDSSSVDYVIAAQVPGGGAGTNLYVWQVDSRPAISFVGYFGVASYQVPPDVPQPVTGTAACTTAGNCIDTGDARLTQAIGRFDPDVGAEAVWTQHAITDPRAGPRAVERWYEIVPATRTVRQSGNVSDFSLHIFNGAVSPAGAGNEAVVFYNAGSSAVDGFVSYRSQSRNALSPLGTMLHETVLASSTANDADFSCGASLNPPNGIPCRWGDYSSARPDPANANGVWGFGMLTGSGGSPTSAGWSTQVAEVTPGCSTVQIASAIASPGVIQFTASGVSGCSSPRYQFWLQAPGGAWAVVQPFGASNTWSWNINGYRPAVYNITVWANEYGDSTAGAESFALTQWTIPFCSSAGVSANTLSPQPSGTQVTLTASSVCPNPNPQYQFWLLPPGGPWTVAQPYSAAATFIWDTTGKAPGAYHFSVWVRDASSSGAYGTPPNTYDAYVPLDFALQPVTCTGMSASAAPAATTTIGSTVSVTGAATGCANPRYQFWLLPTGGSWKLVQPYSTNATYTWDTSAMTAGSYRFSVWSRDASSSSSYDSFSAFQYTVTAAPPCTGMTSSSAPPSTASVGTSVTITGSATGCANPRYQFWLLPPGGSWKLVQGSSTSPTFTWTTAGAAAGTYRFSVWARDAGSSASYDSFDAFNYSLTTTPCTAMAASATPANTASRGTMVSVTGNATGCSNAQYEFWLQSPSGTWTLVRGWSSNATFVWSTSAGLPAGTYRFSVWARDTSSSGTSGAPPNTYDVFSAFNYILS